MRSLTHGTERGGRALRVTALLTLVISLFAIPATAGAAIGGGLKQLTNAKGCQVDEAASISGCEDVRAIQSASDVAVSPNGDSVYVSSSSLDAIAAFDRNASTGELTQKASITGCITSNPTTAGPPPGGDGCSLVADPTWLDNVTSIAISPDGASLYAVNSAGLITALNRDSSGTLTFNEIDVCCNTSTGATAVTVSPDGKSVYMAGPMYGNLVESLTRDTTAGPNLGDITHQTCFGGICSTVSNLGAPTDLAVTPDNKQLLIASSSNSTVLGWNRSESTGALTPSSTASRCVSAGALANCQTRQGIIGVQSLALADNGTRIHVGAQQALATINRDPSTNDLTPDTAGNCFGYPTSGFAGCTPMPGSSCCTTFYTARSVVASPDGENLYFGTDPISAPVNPTIYGFTRSGGNISIKPSPIGCTNPGAVEGCSTFRQGNRIQSLAVANNSRHVYAVGNNRLFTFVVDRAPTCQNVGSNTANNTSVAVKLSCSDPDGDVVTYQKTSDPPKGALGGIQGDSINYVPLTGTSGADSFTYRAVALGVASDPATATVNVAGPVAPPKPPTVVTLIPSTVGNNWAAARTFTTVISLSAKRLPAGASVVVKCKTKSKRLQKKRCPYKSKSFKAPAGKAQVNLAKLFRKRKLPVGTKITITITAPTFIGKVFTYTIRRRAIPKLKLTCLTPGSSTKSVSCPG
jgi:hypothetical protein